ncbi:deoxyuridine triphosphatase [Anaeramoeba ignava]|uniref:Deoxyuridine 5'-triphosphate nucleotidohydrolase n=1 Tax=Anaeramoeba ignava TaxID=1746090 RepID=A0A9Q0LZI8_ANAIG|nr:deoxyuridine triphosphatase [Anaeramoeba ignava]
MDLNNSNEIIFYFFGLFSCNSIQNDKDLINIFIKKEDFKLVKKISKIFDSNQNINLDLNSNSNSNSNWITINLPKSMVHSLLIKTGFKENEEFISNKEIKIDHLPDNTKEELKLAFFRAIFDNYGTIEKTLKNSPICVLFLNQNINISHLPSVPFEKTPRGIEWEGVSAFDLLSCLYKNPKIYSKHNYKKYVELSNHNFQFLNSNQPKQLEFHFTKALEEAIEPQKQNGSDAGFDLWIVKKIKEQNNVHYFDTGIIVEPPFGFYFDMVARSSISKTGYILANSVGIIDSGYRGHVIVALIKLDPKFPEIQLPARIVQLIPRLFWHMNCIESKDLSQTTRNVGGFGSTHDSNENSIKK